MPLLRATAEMMSQEKMERGVIEELIVRDDMFQFLPFMNLANKSYVYHRETQESGAEFFGPYQKLEESAVAFSEHTVVLRAIGGQVDTENLAAQTMRDTNDPVADQIAAKVKAVGRKFHRTMASGDVTADPNGFDGLPRLVAPERTIVAGANGAAVSFSMLDQLKDAVELGADALVMRKGTWRAIKGLMRASGGLQPDTIMMENFGRAIPAFDGLPVLINDFLAPNEVQGSSNDSCSIYAMRFSESDGLFGLTGGDNAGIKVKNLGDLEDYDATRIRVLWYCGLGLKATHALARLKGVTSV